MSTSSAAEASDTGYERGFSTLESNVESVSARQQGVVYIIILECSVTGLKMHIVDITGEEVIVVGAHKKREGDEGSCKRFDKQHGE